jgi:hypothetical protein
MRRSANRRPRLVDILAIGDTNTWQRWDVTLLRHILFAGSRSSKLKRKQSPHPTLQDSCVAGR